MTNIWEHDVLTVPGKMCLPCLVAPLCRGGNGQAAAAVAGSGGSKFGALSGIQAFMARAQAMLTNPSVQEGMTAFGGVRCTAMYCLLHVVPLVLPLVLLKRTAA